MDYRQALANYMRLDAEERRVRKAIESLQSQLAGIETAKDMHYQQNAQAIAQDSKVPPPPAAPPEPAAGPMPAEELHSFTEALENETRENETRESEEQ